MAIRYESCRIIKIKENKVDALVNFIEKHLSDKGIIYKRAKNRRDGSEIPLRLFFISKKEIQEGLDIRIAFDTSLKILDYIKYGEEEEKIRHSILGRMIIYTKGKNKNFALIILKKTRSKKMIAQINKLVNEKIFFETSIDLQRSNATKNLTNFWASGIKDDHEKNISASGVDLEEGTTYKNIIQKRGNISALKSKSRKLNYGLSKEGLIWVIPKEGLDIDLFFSEVLTSLIEKKSLNFE